jgi:metal-responsive CopG/Arc/MetJ family transcriptional regulator
MEKQESEFQRTTVYLPKELYRQAKIRAAEAGTTVSQFMRVALREEIIHYDEKERNFKDEGK